MHENPELIVAKVSRLITGTIDHACLSVNWSIRRKNLNKLQVSI